LLVAGLTILACFVAAGVPVFGQSSPAPDQGSANEVIVSVAGKKITRKDLEDAVAERLPKNYELRDALQVQSMVLKSLVLEALAENFMTSKEIAKIPHLANKLENTRRDILVRAYVDSQTKVAPPTEEAIKKYIAAHPEFYQDRKTYHFGELIIQAKSRQMAAAVRERLNALVAMKDPDLDSVQIVVQWLKQNYLEYGYSTGWKATENLPPAIAQIVRGLEKKEVKVDIDDKIELAGTAFRVVVLFGAYPDPINPAFAQNLTAQRLMSAEIDRQTTMIIQRILAKGKVLLHNKKYSSADLPATLSAPVEPERFPESNLQISVFLNSASLALLPIGLYLFFRQNPAAVDWEPETTEPETTLADVVTRHVAFRIVFVCVVGAALASMAGGILMSEFEKGEPQAFIRSAAAGVVFGVAVTLVFAKIPVFRRLFVDRWAAVSTIALIQAALMFAYESELL
jgi:EpsD family peptidyl-prolyl cis-trans isomerase